MAYVLVMLKGTRNADGEMLHAEAHARFITSLIDRNLVLLGGGFAEEVDGLQAAYLLRCSGLEEARAIAAEDPFVVNNVVRVECVEWRLVGINPDAIDNALVVRPKTR